MADFLNNLIIRSFAGPREEAILKPRLPSLFEAPNSEDAIPVPAAYPSIPQNMTTADPISHVMDSANEFLRDTTIQEGAVENKNIEPTTEPFQAKPSRPKFPSLTSTIPAEASNDQRIIRADKTYPAPLPHQQETIQDGMQPMPTEKLAQTERPPAQVVSLPHGHRSTVVPHVKPQATEPRVPARREEKDLTSREPVQPSYTAPVDVNPQKQPEESQTSPVKPAKPLQAKIKSLKENSAAEETVRLPELETLPTKGRSKQSTILQPILTASLPQENRRFEQPQKQDLPRVVEIHIGRIEVRAVSSTSKDFRKDLTIELYNEAGQLAITYKVYRCWVSEYQAMPDLDANANAVAIQHIKLENEGWERDYEVPEPSEPTFTEPA